MRLKTFLRNNWAVAGSVGSASIGIPFSFLHWNIAWWVAQGFWLGFTITLTRSLLRRRKLLRQFYAEKEMLKFYDERREAVQKEVALALVSGDASAVYESLELFKGTHGKITYEYKKFLEKWEPIMRREGLWD